MSNCECGGELDALSQGHYACVECGDAYWDDEFGFEKDDDFDAEQFADNAIGDSSWRSDE